jgi:hypothetical protein
MSVARNILLNNNFGDLSVFVNYKYNNSKKFWEELIAYFPLIWHRPHVNDAPNYSSIVACVFISTVRFYLAVA